MRKKIAAGNWKMNTTPAEGVKLIESLLEEIKAETFNADIIICPPYIHLPSLIECTKGFPIKIGAQNCHHEKNGAYTGEVSAMMLKSIGVVYVILGHSERRLYNGETNPLLAKKVSAALQAGLIPIYCVGETLEERENNGHFEIIKNQVTGGLNHLSESEASKVVIAYEPVWAIGTGKTASPMQAQEIHAFIRNAFAEKFPSLKENLRILYGGSVKADNAADLFSQKDIDGGLVGGASLVASDFAKIIRSAS